MTQTKEEPKIWTAEEIEDYCDRCSYTAYLDFKLNKFISFQDHQKAISELQVENEKLKECASCEFYNEQISSLKQQIENAKKLIIFESNKKVELEKQIEEKDKLIKFRTEQWNTTTEVAQKFYQFNEQLEKQLSQSVKYKRFVEHIYSHKSEIRTDKHLGLDDWVMCKICNKTINQLSLTDEDKKVKQ